MPAQGNALGKWFVFLHRRPERAAQTPKIGFNASGVQRFNDCSKVQQWFKGSTIVQKFNNGSISPRYLGFRR